MTADIATTAPESAAIEAKVEETAEQLRALLDRSAEQRAAVDQAEATLTQALADEALGATAGKAAQAQALADAGRDELARLERQRDRTEAVLVELRARLVDAREAENLAAQEALVEPYVAAWTQARDAIAAFAAAEDELYRLGSAAEALAMERMAIAGEERYDVVSRRHFLHGESRLAQTSGERFYFGKEALERLARQVGEQALADPDPRSQAWQAIGPDRWRMFAAATDPAGADHDGRSDRAMRRDRIRAEMAAADAPPGNAEDA